MLRFITLISVICSAGVFGLGVPMVRLFDAFQPMIVALSIMVAALFVRLNRGMPSLEWNNLDPVERVKLTSRILSLAGEYALILAIDACTICVLVILTVVGKEDVRTGWPMAAQELGSAAIGAMFALNVSRMAYVIWRDYDIVRLQKHLIDTTAKNSQRNVETLKAEEKISEIRSSGLRKVLSGEPKVWEG